MEFKNGMKVMYRDTPDNNVYQFRPALPRATGSVVGSGPGSIAVSWDKCGLYKYPQSNMAYYRPDRLHPLIGGF